MKQSKIHSANKLVKILKHELQWDLGRVFLLCLEKKKFYYYIHIIMLNYSTGLMLILNSFLTFILSIKNQSIVFNGNI